MASVLTPGTVWYVTVWSWLFLVHCKFLFNRNTYWMWVLGTAAR